MKKTMKKIVITVLCVAMIFGTFSVNAFGDLRSEDETVIESLLSSEDESKRQTVWQKMLDMATVVWKPSKTVYYTHSDELGAKIWRDDTYYVGMPYTQSNSPLERFKEGFNESEFHDYGTDLLIGFKNWIPVQYTSEEESGLDTIDIIMGNDCSGAIYWALSSVAEVFFTTTSNMLPNAETVNEEYESKSGLYYPEVKDVKKFNTKTADSKDAIEKADMEYEDVCAYYNSLEKGDVLVTYYTDEKKGLQHHTVMVGQVVGENIYILEQGGTGFEKEIYADELINYAKEKIPSSIDIGKPISQYKLAKVSFADLFSNNYVPFTLPAYAEEEPSETSEKPTVTIDVKLKGKLYLAYGTVSSTGSRLESVTVTIKEWDPDTSTPRKNNGAIVGTQTLYTSTYRYGLFNNQTPQRLLENSMNLYEFAPYIAEWGLKPNTNYEYILSAHLANGKDYTVKQFAFTN